MITADELARHLTVAHERSMDEGLAAAGRFVAEELELAQEPRHPIRHPYQVVYEVHDGRVTGACATYDRSGR